MTILAPMDQNALISVHEVSFVRQPQLAIQNLNFSLKAGECLVLLGANGTGKTTTLKLLSGLLRADQGKIFLKGFDLDKDPLNAKHYLGMLSDHLPLYPDLTVREYLDLIARLRQIPKIQHTQKIDLIINKLNLTFFQHLLIGCLSKGQKQRVGLAQAMLHQPPVLLLDEPTQGLDPEQIVNFVTLMKEYKQHATIILSTHTFSEVESLCNYLLKFDSAGVTFHDFHPCQI